MTTRAGGTRLPLHITIGSLFVLLVVLLGALLSLQSYSKSSEIILASAEDVYDQVSNEIQLDFKATYRPVVGAVELLALSPVTDADSADMRSANLALFAAALGDGAVVSAIQAAYPNGDYFIVRPLKISGSRERFDAPGDAAFVVDDISAGDGGERLLSRHYFDDALKLVRKNPPVATDYDPRVRPWYRQAGDRPRAITPYLFYFIGKVGTTVTVRTRRPGVVVAADVSLEQLSKTIGRYRLTPGSEAVLLDGAGRALAYHDISRLISRGPQDGFEIAHVSDLGSPVLAHFSNGLDLTPRRIDLDFQGKRWTGSVDKIARTSGLDLNILLLSPIDELLSEAVAIRWSSLVTTAIIVALTIPVVWLVADRVAGPLRRLAAEAETIRRFDFESPLLARSFITEVDSLAGAMRMMKSTINRFLTLINSLAGEREFEKLLGRITEETMKVGRSDAAVVYLVDEEETFLKPGVLHRDSGQSCEAGLLTDLLLTGDHPLSRNVTGDQTGIVNLDTGTAGELKPLLECIDSETATLITFPLRNRQNEAVGVLCLLYAGAGYAAKADDNAQIAFVRALSGFAAVSIESRQLLRMQEALLDAFIKLIAGAIDAKSPYTGGHCQRVPELTRMLAQAACDSNAPPFADYQLSDDGWDALHIASWLHDCGKVTTPEYVVDKATKLETIYDRIHEIRMRFEVLKRDTDIRFWEQLAAGGERATLEAERDAHLAQLDEDFAFVAECNEGGEFMAPERIERLRNIAATTWKRTLDDRIGISWEERRRKERTPALSLPAMERLIDDKPEHLIERQAHECMPEDNPWGFKLDVPEYKYNRGELYNLEVARGTLSEEERYKINDHMVQTIIMLDKLPYPKHLRDVPSIAGCHHETMDGKGYPKRLKREDMSLTARMMAIADIFEALTASDRPYKKAKTLSESIRILNFMKKDRHIDGDLFALFLESGVWKAYAEKFLDPAQIDNVDISQYLEPASGG